MMRAMSTRNECDGEKQTEFMRRQLESQIKKLQTENCSLMKQLKAVKKCASCECRDEQLKQSVVLKDLLNNGIDGTTSTSNPPVDPEPQSNSQIQSSNVRTLRDANDSLQNCVQNLQQLLKEKAMEISRMEDQFLKDVQVRDNQIISLHKQLQECKRQNPIRVSTNQTTMPVDDEMKSTNSRLNAFMKEREQLIHRIQQLEEQLQRYQQSSNLPNPNSNIPSSSNYTMKFKHDSNESSKRSANDALNFELKKAHDKIKRLEIELASQRQRIASEENELSKSSSHLAFLQDNIHQLEQYKRNCEKRLNDQERSLQDLESDIALLMDEKRELRERCNQMKRLNDEAIAENTKHLNEIHELRCRLERCEEKEITSARAHLDEIDTYQKLLKQKESERAMFIEQLCADSRPIHIDDSTPLMENRDSLEQQRLFEVTDQLQKSVAENEKLLNETSRLKVDCDKLNAQLRVKEKELEEKATEGNNLQQQLDNALKSISVKDAQLTDLNNQLCVMEVNLMKNALDELEEMLGQKTMELIESNENAIKANSNAQLHKETVFDLETKLTLQGRELKDTRSKLLSLKSKIRRLEKETSELLPGSKFSSPQSTPTTNLTSPDSLPKTSTV